VYKLTTYLFTYLVTVVHVDLTSLMFHFIVVSFVQYYRVIRQKSK